MQTTSLVSSIKNWDTRSVRELREMLDALQQLLAERDDGSQVSDLIDMSSLPSAPNFDAAELTTARLPVWAVDCRGLALVGADARRVVHTSEI